jgi:hypothetical protein
VTTVLAEVVRLLNSEGLRDVDAKTVIPYLPLLEIFRAARVKDLTFGVNFWKENSSA